MDRRPWRRPQSPPPVPQGGPACGRGPRGCLPSPWSSANAAIFQPARVTSGAAGAGVGAGWGQGCPTLAGAPRFGWPSRRAPLGGDPAAPALWPRALPDVAFLAVGAGNTWLCSSRCAAVPARLLEQWARGTAVRPLSTSWGSGSSENVFACCIHSGGGGIGNDVEGVWPYLPVLWKRLHLQQMTSFFSKATCRG